MASILRQVQDEVAERLRGSAQLSACQILVEDSRNIDFEIKNALGRQGLVLVVTTPKATFAGKFEDEALVWQLDQLEIDCVENAPVNRGKQGEVMTAQEAAMAAFDVLCPLEGGREGQMHPVSYEQGQDKGLLVSRCVLKCLVQKDAQSPGPEPEPPLKMTYVRLLDEAPPLSASPKDGWMWPTGSGFRLWQNGEAHDLGVAMDQVSAYVDSRLSGYLPLSGGEMKPNSIIAWGTDGRICGGTLGVQIFNDVDDEWRFPTSFFEQSANDVARRRDLSSYLPLSGGALSGQLDVGAGVQMWTELEGGVLKVADGADPDRYAYYLPGRIGTQNGNFYLPYRPGETVDEYLATEEWTQKQLSSKADLSALDSKVENGNGISAMLSASSAEWQSISASASPNMLYVVVEES